MEWFNFKIIVEPKKGQFENSFYYYLKDYKNAKGKPYINVYYNKFNNKWLNFREDHLNEANVLEQAGFIQKLPPLKSKKINLGELEELKNIDTKELDNVEIRTPQDKLNDINKLIDELIEMKIYEPLQNLIKAKNDIIEQLITANKPRSDMPVNIKNNEQEEKVKEWAKELDLYGNK